jgi:nitroreductase
MEVSEAVNRRSSVRQFMPDAIDGDLLRSLVEDASHAPSGGNLQPWRIYVVNGSAMGELRAYLAEQPPIDELEYDIYPRPLVEPYRTNRYTNGEQLYATLGLSRDDKAGRTNQFARNNDFFGAPAALFCFTNREMGKPQWSDLGMYLQTFMLLAVGRGLATCAQEYWSVRNKSIRSFVGAPEHETLFCGLAIGYADESARINGFRSDRMPIDQWARFL